MRLSPTRTGTTAATCVRCGVPNPYLDERLERLGWDRAELAAVEADMRGTDRYPREDGS